MKLLIKTKNKNLQGKIRQISKVITELNLIKEKLENENKDLKIYFSLELK